MNWIEQGGVILVLLGAASLLAIAVILERFLFYTKVENGRANFLNQLFDNLDIYEVESARNLCESNPGPLASIAMAGIQASDRDREGIKDVLEDAGAREAQVLSARLPVLTTLSTVAPLLGLLGTVLGLIRSFYVFDLEATRGGFPGIELLAGGIWQALITTAAGLTVGIVCHIAHNYLYTRKERLLYELEGDTSELLEIICDKTRKS